MTLPASALAKMLMPLRDATITALLKAQARAIEAGAEIEAEPIRRGPDGKPKRMGVLELPERGDLKVTLDERTLVQRVESSPEMIADPGEVLSSTGFSVGISRFRWDGALLKLHATVSEPNWQPLRHWFLEWFQGRQTETSPELSGVVHWLDGPYRRGRGFEATVDLGSAPVDCIPALLAAVSQSGCGRLEIVEAP